MKVGIIGTGHLGRAFINGLLKSGFQPRDIKVNAKTEQTKILINTNYPDIEFFENKMDLVDNVDVIVLAVQPKYIDDVLTELRVCEFKNKVLVSFVAGLSEINIRNLLYDTKNELNIIRIMPTVAIKNCEGVVGAFTKSDNEYVEKTLAIFENLGHLIRVDEETLDKLTIIASSGIAFASYIINEYYEVCKAFTDENTSKIVTDSVFSNALSISNSKDISCVNLIEEIATKGGTTEAGIKVLDSENIGNSINKTINAAYKRLNKQ